MKNLSFSEESNFGSYGITDVPLLPGFFKGRLVAVPAPHIPPGAVEEDGRLHLYKFELLNKGDEVEVPPRKSYFDWLLESGGLKSHVLEPIDPNDLSDKETRDLCRRSGIPLGWVKPQLDRRKFKERAADVGNVQYAKKRRVKERELYSEPLFKKFLKCLGKVNKKSRIVAELLYHLNKLLLGGGYVTSEDVLRTQLKDVSSPLEQPNWVHLSRTSQEGTLLFSLCLPNKLMKKILGQINPGSIFVFAAGNGGPLTSAQLDRDFRIASEKAGINPPIKPFNLRPIINFEAVLEEDYELLCKAVPTLEPKRGRKPIRDPRMLLNAMLFHLRAGCPFRKLSFELDWRAAHSQYSRWKKTGVFEEILKILKKICPHLAFGNL